MAQRRKPTPQARKRPETADRYFDSPDYSDVTIRCGGGGGGARDFHAHRVVLASQSRWFAEALGDDGDHPPALVLGEGSTVRGNSDAGAAQQHTQQQRRQVAVLDMRAEDVRVVEGVLCFMYHADYRDADAGTAASVLFNLRMHDAAGRFGVSCLGRCAAEKLRAAAERFWDGEGFLRAVEFAYRSGTETDDAGRAVLVAVAAEHANELSDERAFCELLDGLEGFNAEFTAAVVKTEGIEMVEVPCGYCGLVGVACGCSRRSG